MRRAKGVPYRRWLNIWACACFATDGDGRWELRADRDGDGRWKLRADRADAKRGDGSRPTAEQAEYG